MEDNYVKCKYCDGEFYPNSWNQKYCSITHRNQDIYQKRLKKNPKGLSWEKLSFIVKARDGFKCVYCGRTPVKDKVVLVPDHWLPVARNGQNTVDNLVTSCWDCNLAKRDLKLPDRIKPKVHELSEEELMAILGKDFDRLQITTNLPIK